MGCNFPHRQSIFCWVGLRCYVFAIGIHIHSLVAILVQVRYSHCCTGWHLSFKNVSKGMQMAAWKGRQMAARSFQRKDLRRVLPSAGSGPKRVVMLRRAPRSKMKRHDAAQRRTSEHNTKCSCGIPPPERKTLAWRHGREWRGWRISNVSHISPLSVPDRGDILVDVTFLLASHPPGRRPPARSSLPARSL